MKIKITQCRDYLSWYRELLGQELEVIKEDYQGYWCREPDYFQCLNVIHKQDAVVIKPEVNYENS